MDSKQAVALRQAIKEESRRIYGEGPHGILFGQRMVELGTVVNQIAELVETEGFHAAMSFVQKLRDAGTPLMTLLTTVLEVRELLEPKSPEQLLANLETFRLVFPAAFADFLADHGELHGNVAPIVPPATHSSQATTPVNPAPALVNAQDGPINIERAGRLKALLRNDGGVGVAGLLLDPLRKAIEASRTGSDDPIAILHQAVYSGSVAAGPFLRHETNREISQIVHGRAMPHHHTALLHLHAAASELVTENAQTRQTAAASID